jgi:hypothetical protein
MKEKKQTPETGIPIRPYCGKDLMVLYDYNSPKTLKVQLDAIADKLGPRIGRYWNVKQVAIIFKEIGPPNTTLKPDDDE